MARTLTDLGVVEAADAIRRGEATSTDLVAACLARIEATDGTLKAWVALDPDGALAAAAACDAAVADGGRLGPLHGVPIGIKDIIDVAGLPTTAGAASFAHTHPTRDASLVTRLRAAGGVILGKTVATQFAFKDPAPTLNPWSSDHTPGGSSSGSAVAVAARQVPAAIGTQTVGSILRPSAFCGVVGFKGEHGQVPLDRVLPLAPSFDHGGPIARSVRDAAVLHDVLAGAPEPGELTLIRAPMVGVAIELFDRAESGLRAHLDAAVGQLEEAGTSVVGVPQLPDVSRLIAAGWVILEAEAAAVHREWFMAHAAEYGPAIAGLVSAGMSRTAAEVDRAHAIRRAFREEVAPILASVDALLSPVAPGPAPLRDAGTGDPGLCAPWSFAGLPSISIPTGTDANGLPLAIQLVAGPGALSRLLGVAAGFEGIFGFDARPAEAAHSA